MSLRVLSELAKNLVEAWLEAEAESAVMKQRLLEQQAAYTRIGKPPSPIAVRRC